MARRLTALLGLLGLVLAAFVLPGQAQSRSVFWNSWDVRIDQMDTARNHFRVTESNDVSFTGSFTFGSADIPLDRVESIENVTVSQNGKPLRASCSQQAGTYCVSTSGNNLNIVYYFLAPVRNSTEQIDITYDVLGALRVYEGGDQLWWDAIPTEHYGFPIAQGSVIVALPPDSAPREGVDSVVTYGAPATVTVNGSTVVARTARPMGGDEGLSIRVQYPHNPDAVAPAWQAAFDVQRAYEENVLPLINVAVLAASVLIGLGGTLFVLLRLQTRGRDPEIGPVPAYLSEPPDGTPPAVVGALVDETVDLRDIISTLVDLARRGYVVFEEAQTAGVFGFGVTREFTFKRTDKPVDELAVFEVQLLREVFPGGSLERAMNSMRDSFYAAIPRLQADLYHELVQRKYFDRSPETTRGIWRGMGILLLGASVMAGFGAFFFLDLGGVWLCLPAAGALVGLVALFAAPRMPAKTRTGAESAAKWRAFEQYLRNLDSFDGQNAEAATRFEDYLPYAVAFGIDRSFLHRFSRETTMVMPPWYIPTYRGGRWAGGYTPGTPPPTTGLPGGLATAGGGAFLDDLSGGLSGGLESMSDGLTSMLNSASSVMNSRPRSSSSGTSGHWGGGGGGWSGGGFSGGGGGGGGGRGFG